MLFHGKLCVRPALTVSLFTLFGSKGFGGDSIEMFVHGLTTPDPENGSRQWFPASPRMSLTGARGLVTVRLAVGKSMGGIAFSNGSGSSFACAALTKTAFLAGD